MRLVDQWREIERSLPEDWGDARLLLTAADEGSADRAAALLGPIGPGRRGKQLRFYAARRGAGHRPDLIRRLLARLDAERIDGQLELVSTGEVEAAAPPEVVRPPLAASWDAALASLPSDWSDVYAEVELRSSDHLDRAALLLSPVNPARFGGKPGFRFRAARRFGYGVSPEMARRCFERLDAEGIRGSVRILRALSDTRPVQTQGPVWYVGGRAV
jgi:hypothetical protein